MLMKQLRDFSIDLLSKAKYATNDSIDAIELSLSITYSITRMI